MRKIKCPLDLGEVSRERLYVRPTVGPTDPELDATLEFLHDLGSLQAHFDGATDREVLHPSGAERAGEVGRCLLDAFSKSTRHVN